MRAITYKNRVSMPVSPILLCVMKFFVPTVKVGFSHLLGALLIELINQHGDYPLPVFLLTSHIVSAKEGAVPSV